jgi:hypothetical protein
MKLLIGIIDLSTPLAIYLEGAVVVEVFCIKALSAGEPGQRA